MATQNQLLFKYRCLNTVVIQSFKQQFAEFRNSVIRKKYIFKVKLFSAGAKTSEKKEKNIMHETVSIATKTKL